MMGAPDRFDRGVSLVLFQNTLLNAPQVADLIEKYTTSAERGICPQSSVCKPGNCIHKNSHILTTKCLIGNDTKCDVCDSCQSTTSAEVSELSKGELFHLECMIEEELKGLLGQAKVRCPLCRAMLKKIKYLKEADHEKTL